MGFKETVKVCETKKLGNQKEKKTSRIRFFYAKKKKERKKEVYY